MRTSTARALHLALFGLGLVLYVVFILPRWWVLTGDIPGTLATTGRITTGIPIALAALPVMRILQAGLRARPRLPELALRLRAWSSVLHVVAGALILLTAIVEIWLSFRVAGAWLSGVYGAAGAIAILAFLALYLSFVAAKPPAEPKPPKAARPAREAKPVRGQAKKPTTKRGRKSGPAIAGEARGSVPTITGEARGSVPTITGEARTDEAAVEMVESDVDSTADSTAAEVVSSGTEVDATTVVVNADTNADTTDAATVEVGMEGGVEGGDEPAPSALGNKRPTGKRRHRMRR